jgi:hypothetical protein
MLDKSDVMRPIREAPPEVKDIITKVLHLERDHIVKDRPRLKEDIVRIIKNAITADGEKKE